MSLLDPHLIAQCAVCAFFAITFLQSSIDKVVDWKGNLGFISGHFGSSPLKGLVSQLLATITVVELSAGLFSAIGAISLLFSGPWWLPVLGIGLSAMALLMLFFGQRLAKDYAGAVTLATYFAVAILGLLIMPGPPLLR